MQNPGPTGIWVITDEREDRVNNGFFVVDMAGFNPRSPGSLRLVDVPASYHNGAGGVTFADGHSEIHRWLDPRTTPRSKRDRICRWKRRRQQPRRALAAGAEHGAVALTESQQSLRKSARLAKTFYGWSANHGVDSR